MFTGASTAIFHPTASSTLPLQWLYKRDSNFLAALLSQLLKTVHIHVAPTCCTGGSCQRKEIAADSQCRAPSNCKIRPEFEPEEIIGSKSTSS